MTADEYIAALPALPTSQLLVLAVTAAGLYSVLGNLTDAPRGPDGQLLNPNTSMLMDAYATRVANAALDEIDRRFPIPCHAKA